MEIIQTIGFIALLTGFIFHMMTLFDGTFDSTDRKMQKRYILVTVCLFTALTVEYLLTLFLITLLR